MSLSPEASYATYDILGQGFWRPNLWTVSVCAPLQSRKDSTSSLICYGQYLYYASGEDRQDQSAASSKYSGFYRHAIIQRNAHC